MAHNRTMNSTAGPRFQSDGASDKSTSNGPRILAAVALLMWCVSLAFPALILSRHTYSGLEILLTGWLGLIVLMFAWLANPFFLYAAVRQLSGRPAPRALLFAVALALSTFLIDRILTDEGGGKDIVYGYGLGAILWFLSIFLLATAAGWQSTRLGNGSNPWPLRIGLASLLAFASISIALSVHDHAIANDSERLKLAKVMFKHGPVCAVPDAVPAHVIDLGGLPLQLVNASPYADEKRDAAQLLGWGVPSVRIGGTDYSLLYGKTDALVSRPAAGPVGAILEESNISGPDRPTGGNDATLKLSSPDGKIVSFNQTYKERLGTYCPDLSIYPREQEQPRKLILQALGIMAPASGANQAIQAEPRVNVESQARQADLHVSIESTRPLEYGNGEYSRLLNKNCPVGQGYEIFEGTFSTGTFRNGEIKYPPQLGWDWIGICDGSYVYSYQVHLTRPGKATINLKKNELVGFKPVWSMRLMVSGDFAGTALERGGPRITSISDEYGELTIALLDNGSTRISELKAPTPTDGRFSDF